MKKSLIYIAVFSAMMMVTGCGGDGSANGDNGQNVQLDTAPIKQNTLYGANVDGIPSYYVDDGQNQVSYFHENDQWYGIVENKDGKTNFSFSDDLKEFTASNDKENQTLKIKQIDDKTVYQIVSDLNNNVLSAFAYFEEDGKTFIAPLNAKNQIDQTKKQDITEEYKNAALQFQQGQISTRSVVTNIFSSVSAKGLATFNEIMVARSPVNMNKLDCSVSADEAFDTALEGDYNKTAGKLLVIIGGAVAGNTVGIVVGALVGGVIGGVTIPGFGAPFGAKWGAVIGAALTTALFCMQNANGAEVELNNQQAINKLKLTNSELDEWKKFLEEANRCQNADTMQCNLENVFVDVDMNRTLTVESVKNSLKHETSYQFEGRTYRSDLYCEFSSDNVVGESSTTIDHINLNPVTKEALLTLNDGDSFTISGKYDPQTGGILITDDMPKELIHSTDAGVQFYSKDSETYNLKYSFAEQKIVGTITNEKVNTWNIDDHEAICSKVYAYDAKLLIQ